MPWNPWKIRKDAWKTAQDWLTTNDDPDLIANGVHAIARLVEFNPTGAQSPTRLLRVCEVAIEFETQDGRTIQAKGKVWMKAAQLDQWTVGHPLHIRYDPNDPNHWAASEPDAEAAASSRGQDRPSAAPGAELGGVQVVNASGDDPYTVIQKLARIRDQGLISAEQFEAAKRQVEGGAGTAPVQGSSVTDRLHQLDQLHNQSLITDEEYMAERQRILESI
jgi:hypothetical protein